MMILVSGQSFLGLVERLLEILLCQIELFNGDEHRRYGFYGGKRY